MGKEIFLDRKKEQMEGKYFLLDPKFTDFKTNQPKAIEINKKKKKKLYLQSEYHVEFSLIFWFYF